MLGLKREQHLPGEVESLCPFSSFKKRPGPNSSPAHLHNPNPLGIDPKSTEKQDSIPEEKEPFAKIQRLIATETQHYRNFLFETQVGNKQPISKNLRESLDMVSKKRKVRRKGKRKRKKEGNFPIF